MDAQHSDLTVAVHLLVSKGDFTAFHQAIDRLLQGLNVETPLFLISEQGAPVPRYECRKRKFEFPGISVTLFLREDLGEERISLLHSFFQLPPWDHVNTELNLGQFCTFSQNSDEFYCLDVHTPVWGIRRVHYGTEILRVTLYCSCDNYEDAVRLYETILGMEATSQKFGFCFFVLHSTKHISIQLSLKQLPPGVSVQVKDACALQFTIQAIGQLVPLLPYPCVPISDTRWQTQDYDGNRILLLVADSSWVAPDDGTLTFQPQSNPFTAQILSLAKPTKSTQEEKQTGLAEVKCLKTFQAPCTAFTLKEKCHIFNRVCRPSLQSDETETNVDTGHEVQNLRHHPFSVYRLSRDPQKNPVCEHNQCFLAAFKDAKHLASTEGNSKLPPAVKQNKGVHISIKIPHSGRSHGYHSNGNQLREEFFI
ncbi:PREDICTED: protein FAM124B [Nanorana parkeri]|uniref:protein FAM124B n=1 Tax=Nanorana parkeri TaxID=125878 RepID=UPI0008548FB1|nr:PREDICTED: protein FAM124B [Nanorana parkeri]